MARRSDLQIRADGLAKLRRDLRAIDKDLGKALTDHLRDIARGVRDDARRNLHDRSKNPQNRIEKTIKHSVRARGASIYSDHPGAPVQEWGGTIRPRGVPIEIRGKRFMRDAVEENTKHVEDELGRSLDVIADAHGFH